MPSNRNVKRSKASRRHPVAPERVSRNGKERDGVMNTLVKLGPADHGRPMTYEEYLAGDYQGGYHYELIDGKLYVTPLPNLPENRVEIWLLYKLFRCADDHPRIINYVTNKSRVFVHTRTKVTTPEPDLAAYRDFPVDL